MSRTALLVIDVQSALIAGADRGADVLATIAHLVERARGAGTPVIYLQHCHATYQPMMKGAAGWQIHPDVAPKLGELVIEKTASDGFYQTSLQSELDRPAIERLIICGLQTEFCVDARAGPLSAADLRSCWRPMRTRPRMPSLRPASWCNTTTMPWRIWRIRSGELLSSPAPRSTSLR